MTFVKQPNQISLATRVNRPRRSDPIADAFGSTIAASELPRECKPPYRGRTVGAGDHCGWRYVVRRIDGDPLPHVVVTGFAATGKYQAHAKRLAGATPATVRQWVDSLIAADVAS
jgi:hypothetical protein